MMREMPVWLRTELGGERHLRATVAVPLADLVPLGEGGAGYCREGVSARAPATFCQPVPRMMRPMANLLTPYSAANAS